MPKNAPELPLDLPPIPEKKRRRKLPVDRCVELPKPPPVRRHRRGVRFWLMCLAIVGPLTSFGGFVGLVVCHVVVDETARAIIKEKGIAEMIKDYILGKKPVAEEPLKSEPEKKMGWEPVDIDREK
jgi:hypothetical protein